MAKWITIRYTGSRCKACNAEFQQGERAKWYRSGVAYHKTTWVMDNSGDWRPGECIAQLASRIIEQEAIDETPF